MMDKPDKNGLTGIAGDGKGVARGLLDDPDLKRALEKLTGGMAEAVGKTRANLGDEEAVRAFEEALVGAVIEGVNKAIAKN